MTGRLRCIKVATAGDRSRPGHEVHWVRGRNVSHEWHGWDKVSSCDGAHDPGRPGGRRSG